LQQTQEIYRLKQSQNLKFLGQKLVAVAVIS